MIARSVDQLAVTLGSQAAAITVQQAIVGLIQENITTLFAQWSLDVDVNGVIGGMKFLNNGTVVDLTIQSNRLRMIWSLPNNEFTVDITASKAGCKAAINTRLKGGSRQYSLFDGGRFLFCAKPRITQTSCNIR